MSAPNDKTICVGWDANGSPVVEEIPVKIWIPAVHSIYPINHLMPAPYNHVADLEEERERHLGWSAD